MAMTASCKRSRAWGARASTTLVATSCAPKAPKPPRTVYPAQVWMYRSCQASEGVSKEVE